jgi:hypothetical protein
MKLARLSLAIVLASGSITAFADDANPLFLPGGIVFPEYNSEGATNPGTLSRDDTRLARAMVTPYAFGNANDVFDLDYTFTQPKWGLDGGYDLTYTPSQSGVPSSLVHYVHGGGGYRLDALGFGATYGTEIGGTYNTSDLRIGLVYGTGKSRFALVLDNLTVSPSVILGTGVHEDNVYSLELNLGLPPFSPGLTAQGATYSLSLASSLYLKDFGVGYITYYGYSIGGTYSGQSQSFFQTPLGFTHSFSLLYKFTKTGTLSLRFNTNDYLTLACTFRI